MIDLSSISAILPITAIVAILIFFGRECLDWRRRVASDGRKVIALKRVLARECELNYSATTNLVEALGYLRNAGVDGDASIIQMHVDPAGGFILAVSADDGGGYATVLKSMQRDFLLKHLVDIAALDEILYSKCAAALDGLAEAEHVYQSLVHGPSVHFPSKPEDYYDGLIDYGLGELEDSNKSLKDLYFVCTGTSLTQGRIR